MGRRNRALVPIVALVLGVLAILFSFLAYVKRIKSTDVGEKYKGECVYPSSPASGLGIVAALFLLASQIIISVGTSCFCCCGLRCLPRCTTITSLILFILSWATFVIAFMGLIYTALLNSSYLATKNLKTKDQDCLVRNANLFFAAIWCILTLILSLISYAFSVCGSERDARNVHLRGTSNYDVGVAMGQPHMSHMQQPKEQI